MPPVAWAGPGPSSRAAKRSGSWRISPASLRAGCCFGRAPESLDAVVANPPYVSDAEFAELDPAVRMWEPASALRAGPDGLEATRRVLDDGRRVLRPGGWLVMELAALRASAVGRLAH